jgi:glycerol uptake facilitator-like aquaporin
MALGRYEFVLIFIAGPAVVWAVWFGRPFPSLLVYWVTTTLLVLLIQRGNMENLAVLTLPGYLLVGRFINGLTHNRATLYRWAMVGAMLIFGLLFYFNLVRYSRLAAISGNLTAPSFNIVLFVAGFLLILIAFLYVWNRSPQDAVAGTAVGFLAVLLFFSWGTTWNLAHNQANDTRERIVTSASDDELPLLAATIREVSRQTRNADNNLEILMTIDSPALRWYLRDFDNLVVDAALPRTIDSDGLITPMESIPSLETGYVGADFGYYRPDTEHILSLPSALNWWFFRQSSVIISEERAIFWLRADLAGEAFTN